MNFPIRFTTTRWLALIAAIIAVVSVGSLLTEAYKSGRAGETTGYFSAKAEQPSEVAQKIVTLLDEKPDEWTPYISSINNDARGVRVWMGSVIDDPEDFYGRPTNVTISVGSTKLPKLSLTDKKAIFEAGLRWRQQYLARNAAFEAKRQEEAVQKLLGEKL